MEQVSDDAEPVVDDQDSPPTPPSDELAQESRATRFKRGMWTVFVLGAVLIGSIWYLLPEKRATNDGEVVRLPTPVSVIAVPKGLVRELLRIEGTAHAVRREFLTFEQTGRVVYIAEAGEGGALRPGVRVTGGDDENPPQLLARVDARDQTGDVVLQKVGVSQSQQDVKSALAQISQAKSDLALSRARVKRAEGLYQAGDTSLAQVEEARASVKVAQATLRARRAAYSASKAGVTGAEARLGQAETRASRTEIRAPFDGVIAAVNLNLGDYVTGSTVDRSSESRQLATAPITIVDPTEYEVTVELPAFDVTRVKPGQMAVVIDPRLELERPKSAAEFVKMPISVGRVYSVARAVDASSRTVRVRIRTRHNPHLLAHGQFVQCIIVTEQATDVPVLPLDVVVFRDGKPFVYVLDSDGKKVDRRSVVLGVSGDRTFEVLDGVSVGDKVVADGRFRMTPGAAVSVVREDVADIGWQDAPPIPSEAEPPEPKPDPKVEPNKELPADPSVEGTESK